MLGFNSYATIYLSAAQTARISAGNHMEFDSVSYVGTVVDSGDVSVTTGSGQSNGLVTLSNKRFLVWPVLWAEINEGYLGIGQYDHAGGTLADEAGDGIGRFFLLDSNNGDLGPRANAFFIVDATSSAFEIKWMFETSLVLNPVSVNGEIYCMPLSDTTSGGATFDSYAVVSLSANQTTNLSAGNHVEFDTIDRVGSVADASAVSLSTGAGQANGQVTLSGHRFLISAQLKGQTNEGRIVTLFTDGSGTNIVEEVDTGIPGGMNIRDSNQHDKTTAIMGCWLLVDASTSDVTIEQRFSALNNPVEIDSATRMYIVPIQ